MTKRYWAAVVGSLLGSVLSVGALLVILADHVDSHRIFAGTALYVFGWGQYRFGLVGKEEVDAVYSR